MAKKSETQISILSVDLPKDHPCADAHRTRLLQAIDDLIVTNADEINEVLKESSKQARTVGLAVKFDISSGLPEVGVKITVSRESKKDSRRIAAEDPDQLPLAGIDQKTGEAVDPTPEKKTKKSKKKAS